MLDFLDGLLTLGLGLLAILAGWWHCVDETPTHGPGLWSNIKAQVRRVRLLGWILVGLVLFCAGGTIGIHIAKSVQSDRQMAALDNATRSLDAKAESHTDELRQALTSLTEAKKVIDEQRQRMIELENIVSKIGTETQKQGEIIDLSAAELVKARIDFRQQSESLTTSVRSVQKQTGSDAMADMFLQMLNSQARKQLAQLLSPLEHFDLALEHCYLNAQLERLPPNELTATTIEQATQMRDFARATIQQAKTDKPQIQPLSVSHFETVESALSRIDKWIEMLKQEQITHKAIADAIVGIRRDTSIITTEWSAIVANWQEDGALRNLESVRTIFDPLGK